MGIQGLLQRLKPRLVGTLPVAVGFGHMPSRIRRRPGLGVLGTGTSISLDKRHAGIDIKLDDRSGSGAANGRDGKGSEERPVHSSLLVFWLLEATCDCMGAGQDMGSPACCRLAWPVPCGVSGCFYLGFEF